MAGGVVVCTASCTAFRAVCGGTPDRPGAPEPVTGRLLSLRVGWLANLTQAMADQVIAGHWSDADLAQLAGGLGPDGRAWDYQRKGVTP